MKGKEKAYNSTLDKQGRDLKKDVTNGSKSQQEKTR